MTWDLTWRKHFVHDDEWQEQEIKQHNQFHTVSLQKYSPRTFVDLLWMADPAPWPASRVFQRHVAWRPARSSGNRCVMVKVEDSRCLWSTFDVFFAILFVHVLKFLFGKWWKMKNNFCYLAIKNKRCHRNLEFLWLGGHNRKSDHTVDGRNPAPIDR